MKKVPTRSTWKFEFSQEEKDFECENKILRGMKLREYNAFLVNNRDRLVQVFSKINQEQIADIKETETKILEQSKNEGN